MFMMKLGYKLTGYNKKVQPMIAEQLSTSSCNKQDVGRDRGEKMFFF